MPPPWSAARPGPKLRSFHALIDVMRETVAGQSLRHTIEHVLHASGLQDHYRADKEGQERLENLDELINAAESFVLQEGFGKDAIALPLDETASTAPAALTQSPASQGIDPRLPLLNQPLAGTDADTGETLSPLQAFLVHAALEAGDNQAQAGQDAVQLMTVHASKGLEFDAVFIVGLEEGLFPHENALSDKGGLEEERRLMYVAITRARQRLYLSHAQSRMLHGRTSFNLPSRFLDELPSACVKHLGARGFGSFSPKKEAASAYSTRFSNTFNSENIIKSADTALASKNPGGIAKGQTVFHAKFGEGRVLAIEGVGDDARAQVNFPAPRQQMAGAGDC